MVVGRLWTLGAALAAASLPVGATAGQRSATLTVSVQVVDGCASATGGEGLATQACNGSAQPVAVQQDSTAAGDTGPPADEPVAREPVARETDTQHVTVIY
jgi:hypothetical protein